MAAEQATIKELAQNEKVRAAEAIYKPGDVSPSAKRPMRVVRAIKGGTLERTYEDGKKEVIEWKAGDVKILSEERPYSIKNIGGRSRQVNRWVSHQSRWTFSRTHYDFDPVLN